MEKNINQNIKYSLLVAFGLLTTLWLIYGLDMLIALDLRQFGVQPRSVFGLIGVVAYPLLHGNLEHILANSAPAFVLTFMLFLNYGSALGWKVIAWSWLMSGVWLWIAAAEGSNHIGYSGLIYAEASYIFFSGVFRRYYRLMALSMVIVFLYGYMVWGVLPLVPGVSWEGHLFGLVAGAILAFYFRNDGPQRPMYSWEIEPEEDGDEEVIIFEETPSNTNHT